MNNKEHPIKREYNCKYYPCPVTKNFDRACAGDPDCQTYKFYERYGEYYLGRGPKMVLGLGAMMLQDMERVSR